MYDNLDPRTGERVWTDLCRGPHLPRTNAIPAFSLTRSAAAYWRGSEKNPQLQRIYGTAWESKDAHKAHLERLAEAERRDHRRLGAELDLFSFPDEIGSGLAVFHPKGGVIKREMEDYVRARHIEEGFDYVGTPHITKRGVFETSGHLPYYDDTMFPPMELENSEYYLKAMNCPMHNLIFRSRGRSYRELPLRFFEFGSVYRYEKSGVVHGLTRVRGLTQDDSHSYVTPEQAPGEIRHLLAFVLGLLGDFGLDDYYLELSTRGTTRRTDKFIGSEEEWAVATAVLEDAAKETGLELVPDPGGAAFYGPKISVQARDAIGRTWQMSTIQYDFNQPARFGLEYTSADGARQQPVMIHSAKFGSIERFFGVLTEHYAGAFPAWLAPVQVVGIPITDEQVPYLTDVALKLKQRGIRVEIDDSDDRMQKKIRTASKQKIPFVLLAGATDAEAGAVSFRYRDGSQRNGVPVDEAVEQVAAWIASRYNLDPSAESSGAAEGRVPLRSSVDLRRRRAGRVPGEAFEHLWTPYRMAYIRGEGKPTGAHDCPFCVIPTMGDEDGLIVARGTTVYAVLNLYPVQRRPPDAGPVPARARLHRPHRRRGRRARRLHPDRDAGRARGQRGARVQHRDEPGLGRRRRHRRPPAPARGAPLGRRHQLHAGHRPDPGPPAGADGDPGPPRRRLVPTAVPSHPPRRGGLSARQQRPPRRRPLLAAGRRRGSPGPGSRRTW